jgi:hypothetical protein
VIHFPKALTRVCEMAFGRRTQRKGTSHEVESLADFVVNYACMRLDENGIVFVEVDELAFRFREDPRSIREALSFLENDRRAQKTRLNGLWKLQPYSEKS